MTKDPAFLCYSGDVLKDTAFMTDAQTGIYLKAMVMQHIHMCISSEKLVLLFRYCSDGDKLSVMSTFTQDADGSYFIAWLRDSIQKREKFSNSRSLNGSKGGRGKTKEKEVESTSFSSEKLSAIAIENVIVIAEKGVQGEKENTTTNPSLPTPTKFIVHSHWPTLQDCEQHFTTKGSTLAEAAKFYNFYTAQGWVTSGGAPIVNWRFKADERIANPKRFEKEVPKETGNGKIIDSNKYLSQDHGSRKQTA
jgi:hypothetical protein